MNKGRPKSVKQIEELSFKAFQKEITIFRNSLIDFIDDEDMENQTAKYTITKFLNLDLWKQNLYIVYLLNKDKNFTFTSLADLLQVDRKELMTHIRLIKKEVLPK